jgi:hypothetical protein
MEEYSLLLDKAIYNFGNLQRPDVPDSHFMSLAIPKKYVGKPFCESGNDVSGVKAFIFFLDFCVSIHKNQRSILQQPLDGQSVLRLGMGAWIPRTKELVMKFIREMQMCIVQFIATKSQLGTARTLALEYDTYIYPLTTKIEVPQPNNRYPDFAGNSWISNHNTHKEPVKTRLVRDVASKKMTTTIMPASYKEK